MLRTPRFPRVLLLLLLPATASPLAAWTPETRVELADQAIRLMPESLRTVLESQREALLRGVLAPALEEDEPTHAPPWLDGSLDRTVEERAASLATALARGTDFRSIAGGFGELAHFVMDAGFPPGVGGRGADVDRRYRHFSKFCDTRRERFPLVFYGHADEQLERGDIHGYALQVMERARAEDRELARAYAEAGEPPDPAAFDDRSVPFAVGSLCYSHTVTDIVRVWLTVWAEAGGDTGRTPYRKSDRGRP
jgi:hypothetical protein